MNGKRQTRHSRLSPSLQGDRRLSVYRGANKEWQLRSKAMQRCLTRFADRMGRLLFKQSVESNVACHLLAEDVDMSYEEYEHLRNECIREVKQCHGELNFMDEQFYYTEPPQLPGGN